MDLSYTTEPDGKRKVWGCCSIPTVDREKELILREALEEALSNYMALPVFHYNHTERPIGMATSAQFGQDHGLYVEGYIKPTDDCDDVWSEIQSGKLTQWSIYGKRIEGNQFCRLDPQHRSSPCVTSKMRLDSISICPKGDAINQGTFLEIVKALAADVDADSTITKSTDSSSGLIHATADGAKQEATMPEETPDSAAPTNAILKEILDRLDRLEDAERNESYQDEEPDEIEKADGDPTNPTPDIGPGDQDDDDEEAPDMDDVLSTIGETLTLILKNQAEIKEALQNHIMDEENSEDEPAEQPPADDDGGEVQKADPELTEQEEEAEEEKKKECPIQKGKTADLASKVTELAKQNQEIMKAFQELQEENKTLKKSLRPKKEPVVIQELVKKGQTAEIKKSTGTGADSPVSGQVGIFNRIY